MARQETLQPQLIQDNRIQFLTSGLHKDQLNPGVRKYAENLYTQLQHQFQARNINSMEEMENAARSGKITLEELRQIQELIERLKTITSTGEVPEAENENIEQELKKNLKPFVEEWMEYKNSDEYKETVSSNPQEEIYSVESSFLKEKVDSLYVPYDFLITDPDFSQRMLRRIFYLMDIGWQQDAGLLVSLIINKSLEDIPKEEMEKVYQVFNATEFKTGSFVIAGLGYKLPGGTLIIKGEGNYIGVGMRDGKIIADYVRYGLGELMEGGEIHAEKSDYDCGRKMKNGKIFVKKTFSDLGHYMQGGEIRGENLGHNACLSMKSGLVIGGEAGQNLGTYMEGGKIEVKITGKEVGYGMTNGEIYIEEDYDTLGNYRPGGKVYVKGKEVIN